MRGESGRSRLRRGARASRSTPRGQRGWAELFDAGEGAFREAALGQLLNPPGEALPQEVLVAGAGRARRKRATYFSASSAEVMRWRAARSAATVAIAAPVGLLSGGPSGHSWASLGRRNRPAPEGHTRHLSGQ